jgi:hypothetical protein
MRLLDSAPTLLRLMPTHEQGSGVRADDTSWQGGLLPWLQRLQRDSAGRGGALLILDNAEELLAAAREDQPGSSSLPNAQVRHGCFFQHCGHGVHACSVGHSHLMVVHARAPPLPIPSRRRGWLGSCRA